MMKMHKMNTEVPTGNPTQLRPLFSWKDFEASFISLLFSMQDYRLNDGSMNWQNENHRPFKQLTEALLIFPAWLLE